jgi:hypothetical protein
MQPEGLRSAQAVRAANRTDFGVFPPTVFPTIRKSMLSHAWLGEEKTE